MEPFVGEAISNATKVIASGEKHTALAYGASVAFAMTI